MVGVRILDYIVVGCVAALLLAVVLLFAALLACWICDCSKSQVNDQTDSTHKLA